VQDRLRKERQGPRWDLGHHHCLWKVRSWTWWVCLQRVDMWDLDIQEYYTWRMYRQTKIPKNTSGNRGPNQGPISSGIGGFPLVFSSVWWSARKIESRYRKKIPGKNTGNLTIRTGLNILSKSIAKYVHARDARERLNPVWYVLESILFFAILNIPVEYFPIRALHGPHRVARKHVSS